MILFYEIKNKCASKSQNDSCGQDDLCMQGIFSEMKPMLIQIIPDEKTNSADDNQSHNRNDCHRMIIV